MKREDFLQKGVVMPLESYVAIRGLFGPYRCLSNFHVCPFVFEGLVYQTPEAAYMAQKTLDPALRKEFSQLVTGPEAKALGRKVTLRKDWDAVHRIHAMYRVALERFAQDDASRIVLLSTGNLYIEETNWWGDRFWGSDDGGLNHLGHILMSVRGFYAQHSE